MIRAVLGLILLVSGWPSASAQPTREPLTDAQRSALYAVPIFATVAGALAVQKLEGNGGEAVLFSLPLLASGAVCMTGRVADIPGSCKGAFIGGALGALPAVALIGGAVAYDRLAKEGFDHATGVFIVVVGLAAYVFVPPFTAVAGYRRGAPVEVLPAHFTAPDGRAHGLTLRIGL